VQGAFGLRSLGSWDDVFESDSGHGYMSKFFIVVFFLFDIGTDFAICRSHLKGFLPKVYSFKKYF
jgi:hypothetical protein